MWIWNCDGRKIIRNVFEDVSSKNEGVFSNCPRENVATVVV
jgi:hypothetical protein